MARAPAVVDDMVVVREDIESHAFTHMSVSLLYWCPATPRHRSEITVSFPRSSVLQEVVESSALALGLSKISRIFENVRDDTLYAINRENLESEDTFARGHATNIRPRPTPAQSYGYSLSSRSYAECSLLAATQRVESIYSSTFRCSLASQYSHTE